MQATSDVETPLPGGGCGAYGAAVYWLQPPPYLRWAAATLLVVGALVWDLRGSASAAYPFAAPPIAAPPHPGPGHGVLVVVVDPPLPVFGIVTEPQVGDAISLDHRPARVAVP